MSISSLTWLWGAFVNDYALFFHIVLVTLEHLGLWLEISTSVNLSKADSTFGIRLSRMAMQERLLFSCFFLARLWDCTAGLHKKGCYSQWCNTYLSRIDRIFVNLPVAEARDFHCFSHVFENLGERSIPWLHRFKLPNLPGNLSPRVEEAGVYVKRVNMEREGETLWTWCSASTGGWRTGCLCHTQSFELSLLFSCFIVHSFWKGMSCLKTFLTKQLETLFFFHSFG